MRSGSLRRDLGLDLRRLRHSPAFTAFAVVTLGLGIGVATAACSAMYVLAWADSLAKGTQGQFNGRLEAPLGTLAQSAARKVDHLRAVDSDALLL